MPKRKAPTNVRKAALSFVEPFGLGVAKAVPQWRLTPRQPRPPAPTAKRGRGK
jgi:hypothetical protein